MPLQEPVTRNLILDEPPRRATWIGPVVGFVAGLLVGGLAVWAIGSRKVADPQPTVATAAPNAGAGRVASFQPAATPLEVPGATPDEFAPPAQNPAEQARAELNELISAINEMPETERQAAVNEMLYRLRSLGPEGLQTVRDFLKSGQDVKLRNGIGFGEGGLSQAPSLRLAMIDALDKWRDPAALAISLEVLQETPDFLEAILAIRNLEHRLPGTYRGEALKTVQELLTVASRSRGIFGRTDLAVETLRYFKAPELMAVCESLLSKEPHIMGEYVRVLMEFPEPERRAAIQRLFSDQKLVANLSLNPNVLKHLDLTDTVIRTKVANVFATRLTPNQQDEYLRDFGQNVFYGSAGVGLLPGDDTRSRSQEPAVRRLEFEAKLQLLDQIAPYAATPVLQQRVSEAYEGLTKLLQQP